MIRGVGFDDNAKVDEIRRGGRWTHRTSSVNLEVTDAVPDRNFVEFTIVKVLRPENSDY